jgi:hypothetical protein
MFLGLQDADPSLLPDPDYGSGSGSFNQQAKKLIKPIFLLFSDFLDLLPLKIDVKVPGYLQ